MPPIKSTPFVRPSRPLTAADARNASRDAHVERGVRLNYIGLGYTAVEAIVGVLAGMASGSVALMGFGTDAAIEFAAGITAHWRLTGDGDETRREQIEWVSHRFIGACLLALAAYVTWESVQALRLHHGPERSYPGLVLAVVSAVFMPWLAAAKAKVAYALRSGALKAQATQTRICAWLAAVLLAGLLLDYTLGWWWADAVAALVMVPLIVKEGWEGVRGHVHHHFLTGEVAEVQSHRAPMIIKKEH